MNMNNFAKANEQLQNKVYENNNEINELDRKIRILKRNSKRSKTEIALAFSMLPIFISMIMSILFIRLSSFITSELISFLPLITFVLPVSIGIFLEKRNFKKSNFSCLLKEFSKASSEEEIVTEIVKYNVEKQKLECQNKLLMETKKQLENDEKSLESISTKYNVTLNVDNKLEELDQNINHLKNNLKENNNLLNIYIAKKFLQNTKHQINDKYITMMNSMMYGLMIMMVFSMPQIAVTMLRNDIVPNMSLIESLMQTFLPFIGGGAFYYILERKSVKIEQKAYDNVKSEIDNVECFNSIIDDNKIEELYENIKDEVKKNMFELEIAQINKESIVEKQNINLHNNDQKFYSSIYENNEEIQKEDNIKRYYKKL